MGVIRATNVALLIFCGISFENDNFVSAKNHLKPDQKWYLFSKNRQSNRQEHLERSDIIRSDTFPAKLENSKTHSRAERSWLSRNGIPEWYKPCSDYPDDTVEFLKTWNIEGAVHLNKVKLASWAYATNLTSENAAASRKQKQLDGMWRGHLRRCASRKFENDYNLCKLSLDACPFKDEVCPTCDKGPNPTYSWTVKRQLKAFAHILPKYILRKNLPKVKIPHAFNKYMKVTGKLSKLYSSARVPDMNTCKPMHPFNPDIEKVLEHSSTAKDAKKAWNVQRYYWDAWYTTVGKQCRPVYKDFLKLSNYIAKENGYPNTGVEWQHEYDLDSKVFEGMIEKLWLEIKPFYELLHGYVRHKLSLRYGNEYVSNSTDPIPEHIFGNMWAQEWASLYPILEPFPGNSADATPEIQKLSIHEMVKMADNFFQSIGMFPMTKTFWEKSVFEKPENITMVCHASAWDLTSGPGDGNHGFGDRGDFRIKACLEKDLVHFVTIHHEMGHIQYYQQYNAQPLVFRDGANKAFHEAIGDTIALSAATPKHLKALGLLPNFKESEKSEINYLMLTALKKLAFMPFGYMIDKYRWKLFAGEKNFQKLWDEMRLEYQGIMPPSERNEENFDACGKYHIPSNTPYIRYFLAHILQFQFYEHMCIESGQFDPKDQSSADTTSDFRILDLLKCTFAQRTLIRIKIPIWEVAISTISHLQRKISSRY